MRRYIAGSSSGGCFAGVYSMRFSEAESYNAAKGSIMLSLEGMGGGVKFADKVAQHKESFTSSSWAAARGWPPKKILPGNTLDELWQAANEMPRSKGDKLRAVVCRFTELSDYQEALHKYVALAVLLAKAHQPSGC